MNPESNLVDRHPGLSLGAPDGLEWQAESASETWASIGYEAADPSLQSPIWRQTMQELHDEAGGP